MPVPGFSFPIPMRNVALLIEYDGTAYSGWQVQKNGKGIQAVIEETLSCLLQENVKIVGAGRTDAGVHASGQVANFHTQSSWDIGKIVYALNSTLPRDIAILRGAVVPDDFNSRFDAIQRKYIYRIASRKSPLLSHFVAYFYFDLSIELMNEASAVLVGEKSFKSFTKYADQQNHFLCNVTKARWMLDTTEQGQEECASGLRTGIRFEIEANRFLHGMVRAIVGTMIDVGRRKISLKDFDRIVVSQKRSKASMSAPASGLCLEGIEYRFDLWR
jgi:tRNA pseudouridine38-40 synthase